MYKNDKEILNRVNEHYQTAVDLGYDVVGVFLQGSQNYNLNYEGSDIDTKAIILPSFDDFVACRNPISTTYIMPNNEHLDLKDIRVMFKCFEKQNPNFVEILFTRFFKINPQYNSFMSSLILAREAIARYDTVTAVNAISGMAHQKFVALEHPYPSLLDKIEKYGYDPKQLQHLIRMEEFLERYIAGESYADCLLPRNPAYQMEVKKGKHTLDEARIIAKERLGKVDFLKDSFLKTEIPVKDEYIKCLLNNILIEILKKSFKNQLY